MGGNHAVAGGIAAGISAGLLGVIVSLALSLTISKERSLKPTSIMNISVAQHNKSTDMDDKSFTDFISDVVHGGIVVVTKTSDNAEKTTVKDFVSTSITTRVSPKPAENKETSKVSITKYIEVSLSNTTLARKTMPTSKSGQPSRTSLVFKTSPTLKATRKSNASPTPKENLLKPILVAPILPKVPGDLQWKMALPAALFPLIIRHQQTSMATAQRPLLAQT